ncbi:hypothetical protein A0257_12980 [Hymenobacter psoromatis]|nr:hypothetical protein A0257_12980 [Hymenobacter psoromatis]
MLIALLGLATACHQAAPAPAASDANTLMSNDFEHSLGWGGEQPSLTTARAHSGRAAVLASPQQPFSYTFARPLGELCPGALPHRLELTGWVLRTAAGSTARLVVQVVASRTDDTGVAYAALPLASATPRFGEWVAVKLPVELPATATGTNLLKVYLWNDQGTSPAYLDDVVLRRGAE